jgi:hypothetical protein
MDHHDRRTGRIAWTEFDKIQAGAVEHDAFALRRMGALNGDDTGLRDQRQNHKRRHDGYSCHFNGPGNLGHP